MLLHVLIAFVVMCALLVTMSLALVVIMQERRRSQAWIEEQILEDVEVGVFPEWIYGRRMDVPRDRPLLHTRSTKVLR